MKFVQPYALYKEGKISKEEIGDRLREFIKSIKDVPGKPYVKAENSLKIADAIYDHCHKYIQKESSHTCVSDMLKSNKHVQILASNILIKLADKACYKSKQSGRNRVTIYEAPNGP